MIPDQANIYEKYESLLLDLTVKPTPIWRSLPVAGFTVTMAPGSFDIQVADALVNVTPVWHDLGVSNGSIHLFAGQHVYDRTDRNGVGSSSRTISMTVPMALSPF